MNKLTVAALALMATGYASVASAQTVSTSANDLILGFQLDTGVSSTGPTDLEVDLGAYTKFEGATGPIDLSSYLSASDLASISSTWYANTNASGGGLNWSVAGTTANGQNAFDATDISSTPPVTSNLLATPSGAIAQLTNGLNGATQASTTQSALIGNNSSPASSITTSYTSEEAGTGFGFSNLGANAEQIGTGTNTLYGFTQQNSSGGKHPTYPTAVDIGTFTLGYASNTLSFVFNPATATPEPSAYALGICAALLFLVLRRRQSVQ